MATTTTAINSSTSSPSPPCRGISIVIDQQHGTSVDIPTMTTTATGSVKNKNHFSTELTSSVGISISSSEEHRSPSPLVSTSTANSSSSRVMATTFSSINLNKSAISTDSTISSTGSSPRSGNTTITNSSTKPPFPPAQGKRRNNVVDGSITDEETTFPQVIGKDLPLATNTCASDRDGERRKSKEISLSSSSFTSSSSTTTTSSFKPTTTTTAIAPRNGNNSYDGNAACNGISISHEYSAMNKSDTNTMVIHCNDGVGQNCSSNNSTPDNGIGVTTSSSSCAALSTPSSSSSTGSVHRQIEIVSSTSTSSLTTTTASDSAPSVLLLSETSVSSAEKDFHVVKIKISPESNRKKSAKRPLVGRSETEVISCELNPIESITTTSLSQKLLVRDETKSEPSASEVVQVDRNEFGDNNDKPLVTVVNLSCAVGEAPVVVAANVESSLNIIPVSNSEQKVNKQIIKDEEEELVPKMVQKPHVSSSNGGERSNAAANSHSVNSGNTSVTELNVSNPTYLYYMMTSGQFSPCDTLDSGTCSDMDTNSNGTAASTTPPPPQTPMQQKMHANVSTNIGGGKGGAPKLEMHLKTTKIRMNTADGGGDKHKSSRHSHAEHQRAGSLTDSEESESSLSCDSLNSSEFLRNSSGEVVVRSNDSGSGSDSKIASFLPDSLLRDIRDRKFPTNDFETKYAIATTLYEVESESVNGNGYDDVDVDLEHVEFIRERNINNNNNNNSITSSNKKIISSPTDQPKNKKTFVLNIKDGTFVDTKMNSMPRTYEADKYYNFHVNEHENFRSFGSNTISSCCSSSSGSLLDYGCEMKNLLLHDDAFAGYRDIRSGSSATSTIRSSKGTVRGVKNRVRNGIATFLQLQQSNVKNYKEKDFGKVVLYTTSMGIIRDTYAKCSNMKQILRTLLVKFEERDVFMSVEYQQEIKERMHSEEIKVPQLFVEGQHIGDAEHVERLNESGELRQLLKPYKSISSTYTCQTCGGYRLLPCPSCNGSKKSVHRNHFTAEFVALKCMNCDEVGLVKCHNC